MEIERIDADLIRRTLVSWQRDEPLPADLLNLRAIQHTGRTPSERSIALYRLLRALVVDHLRIQRQISGLPPVNGSSADDPFTALEQDFQAADLTQNRALKAWSALYYRYILEMPPAASTLAQHAGYHPRSFRRYVDRGLAALAAVLREIERGNYTGQAAPTMRMHLPAPDYFQLFGVSRLVQDIIALLFDPAVPPFISLEGMGGIGKTVLTQEITKHLARHDGVTGILWISTRRERFADEGLTEPIANPIQTAQEVVAHMAQQLAVADLAGLDIDATLQRLEPLLATGRYVIILDNLDTLDTVDNLLPRLVRCAGLTRYVLTSRHSLGHYPHVHVVKIPELGYDDGERLVRYELQALGRPEAFSEDDMEAIYQVVGGLPLALKFVAHQIGKFPLRRTLRNLQTGYHHKVENLYAFVYGHTWQLLDQSARSLLLSLQGLSPNGQDMAQLRQSSDLPEALFDTALDQLIDFSLLDIRGPFQSPTYHPHQFTSTFSNTYLLRDRWAWATA